ncbi:hypothetical protein G9H71_18620, partial [Motilibacter sp. E257]|nr:hypothetical protein [Motilibacter deserti]
MLEALARLSVRRPLALLLGSLVVAAVAAVLGVPVVSSLNGGSPDFVTPGS